MDVNAENLFSIASRMIPARLPLMVLGAPGIGKTDILCEAARRASHDILTLYPATLDPTDVSGLPVPDRDAGTVRRLPDDLMGKILGVRRDTLLLLDELGQASPSMQAACAPIILARRICGREIPECVSIAATANRRRDHAGSTTILSHIVSRMTTTLTLIPDPIQWSEWASKEGVRPEIVSFIRWRPSLLTATGDAATEMYREGTPYPCPRSWVSASKILGLSLNEEPESVTLAGCVGEGAAAELCAHLRMFRSDLDIDRIIASGLLPKKVKKSPAVAYAVATGVASRARVSPDGCLSVASSMHSAGLSEYAVLLLRDAIRLSPSITSLKGWSEIVEGPLGAAVRAA